MKTILITVFTAALLAACDPSEAPMPPDLAGDWASAPVRLVRGDMDETFAFSVAVADNEAGGIMDIAYHATNDPETEWVVRQDITVTIAGQSVDLIGANPRQIAGPAIEGVYAPDELYCDAPAASPPNTLNCDWGSDAHGDAPNVRLMRAN